MKVTGHRVLVHVDKPPETSAGGIILAEAWQQPPGSGVVVAKGEIVTDLEIGQRVMFRWIDGREVDLKDGRHLKLLQVPNGRHEGEILVVVEQEAA